MPDRVRFTIDGTPAEAEGGTSLLAALWNEGKRAVRRSVGGAARGPLCGMGTCFECRVTIDGDAHRRSCLEVVREGMEVGTGAETGAGPAFGEGFPETDQVRAECASTGTPRGESRGAAPRSADVIVVGGGPAGIAAAVTAAEAGARTVLVDEQARPGGQVWRGQPSAARAWLERLGVSGATVLPRASVVDAPSPRELLVEHEGRPVRLGCERLVLATGARELFLPFPGWTLPGVLGVGGAQALLKAGGRFTGLRVVVAGSGPLLPAVAAALRRAGAGSGGLRVVVAGSGPLLPAVAAALRRAGARIVGIAEQAPLERLLAFGAGLWREPGKLVEGLGYAATLAGVPLRTGAWVREALGGEALERVRATDGRREWTWDCDVLACGFGLVPNLELARLLGCESQADALVADPSQQTCLPGVFAAGELVGIAGVDRALTTGTIAGLAAAGRPVPGQLVERRERDGRFAERLALAFALRPELRALARPDTIVCRCEDVALGRLAASASPREAKLHTRAGMGPCQGRVCGSALAVLRGFPRDSVRPPLAPTPIAVLAGPDEDGGAATAPAAAARSPAPRSA